MKKKKKKAKEQRWLSVKFWFQLFYEGVDQKDADVVLARLASLREMVEDGRAGRRAASKAIQHAMRACARLSASQVLAERTAYVAKKKKKKEKAALPFH